VTALLAGPAGLTVAVLIWGTPEFIKDKTFITLYWDLLKWGPGPGLVCVYISYYLDRQTCSDLPDIVQSPKTIAWRVLNCFAFAALTLLVLLPQLLALPAYPGAAWSAAKLHFVSSGATFGVAFGLALAAQFALRKSSDTRSAVRSAQTAG
jgi:hypothetical protein